MNTFTVWKMLKLEKNWVKAGVFEVLNLEKNLVKAGVLGFEAGEK